MSHHMMKVKRPYTELERVVLPCLEIAADLIHGGKKAVDKFKQVPLSDTTVGRHLCCYIRRFEITANTDIIKSPFFRHTVG